MRQRSRLRRTVPDLRERIRDLERRAISAESRLDWERGTHEAFVAVHHATCEKLAAELAEARQEVPAALEKAIQATRGRGGGRVWLRCRSGLRAPLRPIHRSMIAPTLEEFVIEQRALAQATEAIMELGVSFSAASLIVGGDDVQRTWRRLSAALRRHKHSRGMRKHIRRVKAGLA